jgi:hypothetical protein
VRLVRVGNTITGYISPTGTNWTAVGSETMAMAATIYVGLPITSHVDGSISSATLSSVVVSSDTAGAVPPPPPPAPVVPEPWRTADIGYSSPAGTATYNSASSVWTVKGAGADVWGTADQFRYVSMPLAGDGEIVARVASLQNVDAWTKGGVMMRDALGAGSAQATMFASALKGTAFQRRVTAGGLSTSTSGPAAFAPYWVKMVRIGASFTGSVSADGVTWTQVGSDTILMGDTIAVGLAVTSHSASAVATVTFDNVTVTKY